MQRRLSFGPNTSAASNGCACAGVILCVRSVFVWPVRIEYSFESTVTCAFVVGDFVTELTFVTFRLVGGNFFTLANILNPGIYLLIEIKS